MHLRLLDFWVRYESAIKKEYRPDKAPDATLWLDLLGRIATGDHEESKDSVRSFRRWCRQLHDALWEHDPDSSVLDILKDAEDSRNAGIVLAEALTALMGRDLTAKHLQLFLYSALMIDEPNGIARRRRGTVRHVERGQKTADFISIALSNTALEYLVHRLLRRIGDARKSETLSLPKFIELLRDRYGFYIDRSTRDLQIPGDVLTSNRAFLERRLRDLGLLVGVNDAERMKRLRPRFETADDGAVQ